MDRQYEIKTDLKQLVQYNMASMDMIRQANWAVKPNPATFAALDKTIVYLG